jgi:hypothetical protein
VSRGPFNVNRIVSQIEVRADGVRANAREALEQIVSDASVDYVEELLAAETRTGRARVEAGGNGPGRYDSGDMIADVASDVFDDGDEIVGEWGFIWDVEKYYLAQEHGLGHVPPVFGLETTHARATDKLAGDLRRMVGEV